MNTESHVLTSGLNLNVLIYLLQTDNSKAVNLFWFVLFLSQKSSICWQLTKFVLSHHSDTWKLLYDYFIKSLFTLKSFPSTYLCCNV